MTRQLCALRVSVVSVRAVTRMAAAELMSNSARTLRVNDVFLPERTVAEIAA